MAALKIYLSPSRQAANIYCIGDTNEKEQMEALAKAIKDILDRGYECETYIASEALGIGHDGRPGEAKDNGCSVYLAIHSNAGGGGKASGAVAYYHPGQALGKALASNIVRELSAVCPVKSNRADPVLSGMDLYDGQGLGEIRVPAEYGLTTVLSETDFHDNERTAGWIISCRDAIAQAYVKALADTFSIQRKAGESAGAAPDDVTGENSGPKYYRVQVGAYSQRSNALYMLGRLKEAGFDGYVKYE